MSEGECLAKRALEGGEPFLSGRGVLVTGGSMGIGFACAAEVAARGARVVICARGEKALREAQSRLRARNGERAVLAVSGDVSRERDMRRVVATALEFLERLDGLVHASAVLGPIGPMLDLDPNEWLRTVKIDLYGSFLVAREVGRAMRDQGSGRMVLLSGGGASRPFPNYTAYACSKVGVVRLAETLAQELAPYHITVNALAPGLVATRMHQETLEAGERAGAEYLARTRKVLEEGSVAADVPARAAAFLLSDYAAGITGRFVAAPWDEWWSWPERPQLLADPDVFTLRRVVAEATRGK